MSEKLMNEHEAAQYLGLSVFTLRAWRSQRRGPVFVRLGRAVRYRPDDLEAFLNEAAVEPLGDVTSSKQRPGLHE